MECMETAREKQISIEIVKRMSGKSARKASVDEAQETISRNPALDKTRGDVRKWREKSRFPSGDKEESPKHFSELIALDKTANEADIGSMGTDGWFVCFFP